MVDDGRPLPPFATRGVLGIAGVVALLHCTATAFGAGYWFDEVYMLAIGRYHLDWGSADQPPLTPAVAALADALAPGSLIALRLPAVLATAGAVVVAGLIARELGCDGRAQVFTAAAQATGLWTTLAGHWLTPYTVEPLQWMLLVWLLIRWQRVRDDRLLLVLGVVIGIAAMTKFQVMLLCLVLLVAVAICGPRDLLRRPLLWAGAALAALIAAPTLIWQHLHGWPQLRMTPVVAGEAEALYGGRTGIAVQLLVFAGLAGLVLGSYGLVRLLRADEIRPYWYLGVTFVALYVVFVATAGRPYYLAGLYAPPTSTTRCPPRSGTEPSSSASPTSWRRSSTASPRSTTCRPRTAPAAATATSRRRPPTTTWCSTSEVSRIGCGRTSAMPAGSPTPAMSCTPSSSPANRCRGPCCGPHLRTLTVS
jgi:hypothetical protein